MFVRAPKGIEVKVAANHRAWPHTRILANHHVADNHSRRVNVSRCRDLRPLAAIRPDVGVSSQSSPCHPFAGDTREALSHCRGTIYRAPTEDSGKHGITPRYHPATELTRKARA